MGRGLGRRGEVVFFSFFSYFFLLLSPLLYAGIGMGFGFWNVFLFSLLFSFLANEIAFVVLLDRCTTRRMGSVRRRKVVMMRL